MPLPRSHQIAFYRLVEHVAFLCAHLSRSTQSDVAELSESADAFGLSVLSSMQFRAAEPFRNVRRFASSHERSQNLANPDLLDEYPFVPPLLLATLVSSYSFEVLKEILSTDRVRDLDIWQDFATETDQLGGHDNPDQEQVLCDQYARRFANICVSMADVTLKSEDCRLQELRREGKFFGTAVGDGNCLISSLLQCLHHAQQLPQIVVDNPLRLKAEVRSCRAALVRLAADNPLRPRLRDLRTNEVLADATDHDHAEAYLQFDVHAKWILQFFLARHNVRIPECGIQVLLFLF